MSERDYSPWVLLWALSLITLVVVTYLFHMGSINASDATVLVAIVGVFASTLAFRQWSRERK